MLRKFVLTLQLLWPLLLLAQDWEYFPARGAELEEQEAYTAAIKIYNDWYNTALIAGDCAQQEASVYAKAMALYSAYGAQKASFTIASFLDSNKDCPPTETTGNLYHKLGVFYYLSDRYNQAEEAYRQAVRIRTEVLGDNDLSLSRSYHNLGVALKEKENYESAIAVLRQAARIRASAEESALLADTYYEQAAVYQQMGDYTLALDLLKTALPVFEATHGTVSFESGQTHNEMGITYWNSGDYERAIASTRRARAIFETLYGKEDVDVAKSYINLGNIYDDSGDAPSAIQSYESALSIYNQVDPENIVKALVLNNLGVVFRKMQDWGRSEAQLEASLKLKEQILGPGKHPEKAATLDNLGDLSADRGRLEEALQYYQSAIINRVPSFAEEDFLQNPQIEQGEVLGSWQKLLTVMMSKGDILRKLYRSSKEMHLLQAAMNTYYRCDEIVVLLQRQYETRQSKLFLQEKAMLAYEGALSACYEGYRATAEPAYLHDAFFFMEKSRAVLLSARLKDNQAQQNAKIPADMQEKEQNLRANIAYCERQLAVRTKDIDDKKLGALQADLVRLRQEFDDFVRELEQTYPRYYREKYRDNTVPVKALEYYITQSGAAWLSYFAGVQQSYCLKFYNGNWQLQQLPPRSEWEPLVIHLQEQLANHQQPMLMEDFKGTVRQLYQLIWAPIEEGLPERLLLSPSGALFALPFEILCKADESAESWKKLNYLIQKHQFSYAYSASILFEYQKAVASADTEDYLGVSPLFVAESGLQPLPYNISETKQVEALLGGRVLSGTEATKAAFLAEAESYRILHLSTHASTADGGWIAFAGNKEEARLYLPELYPLKLNAAMAVLSACETAAGKLSRGEGVLSIAHGLSYAGCPSTVASLWPAYHSTSSEIMLHFFRALQSGESKDEALRNAKLDYLEDESTDASGAHPALWAAFVHMGVPDPLYGRGVDFRAWLIAGLAVLLLLAGFFYRRSRG